MLIGLGAALETSQGRGSEDCKEILLRLITVSFVLGNMEVTRVKGELGIAGAGADGGVLLTNTGNLKITPWMIKKERKN